MTKAQAKAEARLESKVTTENEKLYLGDAIDFFLNSKRAGGRSKKTIDDYRKKLELFQRWLAARAGDDEVDAPYIRYTC